MCVIEPCLLQSSSTGTAALKSEHLCVAYTTQPPLLPCLCIQLLVFPIVIFRTPRFVGVTCHLVVGKRLNLVTHDRTRRKASPASPSPKHFARYPCQPRLSQSPPPAPTASRQSGDSRDEPPSRAGLASRPPSPRLPIRPYRSRYGRRISLASSAIASKPHPAPVRPSGTRCEADKSVNEGIRKTTEALVGSALGAGR
jgi:hypothetical protein